MADSDKPAYAGGEAQRLAALCRYQVLDTPPEPAFDDLTRLAAQLCGAPIALVSLVDEHRQWFKSHIGLDTTETPREVAFCDWAIRQDAVFEVHDTHMDARFSGNPLVTGAPGLRFYAGAPLCTPDNHRLGTLCVLDTQPRALTSSQLADLQVLARQVMLQLESSRMVRELQAAQQALVAEAEHLARAEQQRRRSERFMRGTVDALQDNIAIVDHAGTIVHTNQAWNHFAQANVGRSGIPVGMPGVNYLAVCDQAAAHGAPVAQQVGDAIRASLAGTGSGTFGAEYPCHAPNEQRWFIVRVTALSDGGDGYAVVAHQNITHRHEAEQRVIALNATLEQRVATRTQALEASHADLRASEERFRSMFENASVGAVIADAQGRFVQVNHEFARIVGRDRARLLGTGYLDVVHPDDKAVLQDLRTRLIDGRIPGYMHELRLLRPDDSLCWVHLSAATIRDRQGAIVQTLALVQETTMRRQVAYERDQYFERSVDMFVLVDLDGRIQRSNPACLRLLGYTEAQLQSMPYLDLVHPDERAAFQTDVARLVNGEQVDLIDARVCTRDGRWLDVRWSAVVWPASGMIMAVGRDITTRRAAERALQQHEAMLARAEHMAHMGSFHIEVQGGSVRCSNGFLQLAGLSPSHAPSQRAQLLALFEPAALDAVQAALRAAETDGVVTELPCRLASADGTQRELQVFIEPLRDAAGDVRGVSGACIDVTEFKRSEHRLRALADRIQGVREEERTRISREIHDELGQMLTALKIDITLLARDVAADGPGPGPARLTEELGAMTRLVDATLQSVRRIARQLRPEVLDALGLVSAIEWQAGDVQARSGLLCTVDAPDVLSPRVASHGTALFRIVQEALTNVVRHAQARSVVISLRVVGGELRLSVRDDGKGFDPKRADGAPSLGLLGMRERAVADGAQFEIHSAPGQGTEVCVRLRLEPAGGTAP